MNKSLFKFLVQSEINESRKNTSAYSSESTTRSAETKQIEESPLIKLADLVGDELIQDQTIPEQLHSTDSPSLSDIHTVYQLLSLVDGQFVDFSYQLILQRPPDEKGRAYFLDLLRSGRLTKSKLLAHMRLSREGRRKKIKIQGLNTLVFFQVVFSVPLFGAIAKTTSYVIRLPRIINAIRRHVDQIEVSIHNHQNNFDDSLNSTIHSINEFILDSKKIHLNSMAILVDELNKIKVEKAGHSHLLQTNSKLKQITSMRNQLNYMESCIEDLDNSISKKENLDSMAKLVGELNSIQIENPGHSPIQEINNKLKQITSIQNQLNYMESYLRYLDNAINHNIENEENGDLTLDKYATLEDKLRGPRVDIKKRLKCYFSLIAELKDKNQRLKVLDLGCGRGEWLEYLRDNKINAIGVDQNQFMISVCKDLSLNVEKDDIIQYLKKQQTKSHDLITAFQVAEHLPFDKLLALIEESYRVLKPYGKLLLETPNPENIQVGSHTFWMDPTHIHPIPPALLRTIMETCNFNNLKTKYRNSYKDCGLQVYNTGNDFLNHIFFSAQDYAVIGEKQ